MSGRMITLFRKRQIDMTFLGASATQTIVIRRALSVPPFYYYWLGVRLHNRDIVNPTAGGSIFVEALNTLPSAGDPQEFTVASPIPLQVQIQGSSTPGVPGLYTSTSSNQGPYFKIQIRAVQGSVAGSRLYAELSAVLFCRIP